MRGKRKQDNELQKEITRSERGMHARGTGKLRRCDPEAGGMMPKKEELEEMEIRGGEEDKARDVKNGNMESEMEEGPFY